MYKPLQKKNSSWTPTTAQNKSKSPSKLGYFSIQPKPNQKSSQPPEIGEYSRDSADRLAANVMRSLEAKDSQETETPTVQPQSESRISVADVVGQRMPTVMARTLTPQVRMASEVSPENPIQRQCADCASEQQEQSTAAGKDVEHISLAASGIQAKVTVGAPGDKYEVEADTVARQVMSMPAPVKNQPIQREAVAEENVEEVQAKPIVASITPLVQREMAIEDEKQEKVQAKATSDSGFETSSNVETQLNTSKGGGSPLSHEVRSFMEPRFGADFSSVRVHTDSAALQMSQELGAQAFTHGRDVYFGEGHSPGNDQLTAHELTHVVKQGIPQKQTVQRTLGDGHDLASPRFSKLLDLEKAYDNETLIKKGSSGRGVQAIQQALYDIGIPLPKFGADGDFGAETDAAVRQFQKRKGLVPDGLVGPKTMAALDARFPPVTLPAKAKLGATWNWSCVKDILCPWSPHTVDVLSSYTVKSFDSIFWDDEKWNGASWVVDPFPGGGYHSTPDREIGLLNDTCEAVAETLYHEVLHAEQPSTHGTTQDAEGYAYRIGEEFSIAMGLSGRPALRSSDAQGREYADRAKVDASVAAEYPSVAAGGEEIIGRVGPDHDVEVRRPDGSLYVRPANIGEKVPGPIRTVNEVTHDTSKWTC